MLMLWIPGTCGGSKVGRSPGDYSPWGLWGMNLHGELTEDLEWKDRQGLEWKGFRLLAVTAFPLSGGKAPAAPGGDDPAEG
ncbi:MAG: hypothetical protein J5917_08290 [Bacteroidales bacterium]|nr:hypothetical protein [Bacteroidales bacterium]